MMIFDAVNYLKSCCQDSMSIIPTSFEDFYCGVTNDIPKRESEHNVKFLGYVTAKTEKGELELEAMMHDEGFSTGSQLGNAGDDSVYVYVYKTGHNTVE